MRWWALNRYFIVIKIYVEAWKFARSAQVEGLPLCSPWTMIRNRVVTSSRPSTETLTRLSSTACLAGKKLLPRVCYFRATAKPENKIRLAPGQVLQAMPSCCVVHSGHHYQIQADSPSKLRIFLCLFSKHPGYQANFPYFLRPWRSQHILIWCQFAGGDNSGWAPELRFGQRGIEFRLISLTATGQLA